MNKNLESNERYVPPRVKKVEISTRSCILAISNVTPLEEGSNSDNNGYGYDME